MYKYSCFVLFILCMVSCVKVKDIYEPIEFVSYEYPYHAENVGIDFELIVNFKNNESNKKSTLKMKTII